MPFKIVKYQLTSGQQSADSFHSFIGVVGVEFVTIVTGPNTDILYQICKMVSQQLDDNWMTIEGVHG